MESSLQVWNSKVGYPGDLNYREFYRDLGFDAPYEYIRPFLHPDGVRRNVGLKYYRISGGNDLSQRAPYDPQKAMVRAYQHASHFIAQRYHKSTISTSPQDQPCGRFSFRCRVIWSLVARRSSLSRAGHEQASLQSSASAWSVYPKSWQNFQTHLKWSQPVQAGEMKGITEFGLMRITSGSISTSIGQRTHG